MVEIRHAPLFEVDRCTVAPRGILTRGFHFNGFVRTNGNISMWIAHRANRISAQSGKPDQIVGRFLTASGDTVKQLTEEVSAEAGIHLGMLKGLVAVGAVDFCMKVTLLAQRVHCFVCDLELPARFTPVKKDS